MALPAFITWQIWKRRNVIETWWKYVNNLNDFGDT